MMKFLIFFLFLSSTFAHEGPPYPILVNKDIGKDTLSIWADPDVGEGTFQFFLEAGNDFEISTISIDVQAVAPDGTYDQKIYKAEHVTNDTLLLKIPFSVEGEWTLHILPNNGEWPNEEVILKVDVTPPGPSKLEFAVYLIPFILVGLIWIKIIWHKYLKKK